jgi:hypothetical protein
MRRENIKHGHREEEMKNKKTETIPPISVIVVTVGGHSYISRCLDALILQEGIDEVEIIVAYDDRAGDMKALHEQYPNVRFLHIDGNRTFAELRAHGVKKSMGLIVALTEDHCIPSPDWCAQIVEAHSGHHAAVGGAVEKEVPDTAINWALYLCDYLRYSHPIEEGSSDSLTDCNVSYKRAALEATADVWADEFHEPNVHWALKHRAESLWFSPRIVVRQQRSFNFYEAVWDRFNFGRLFGALRVSESSFSRRLIYAGTSFLLPFVLIGRIVTLVFQKRRHIGPFIRAFPALVLLTTVWAAGEFSGYVIGRPGLALMAKVERTKMRHEKAEATNA